MNQIKIKPKHLVFDEKVRLACKSCKNFGFKTSCPPYIESLEYYKKNLKKYKYGIVYYEKFECTQAEWQQLREASSLKIHKHLLKERNKLIKDGHYFYTVLGAGSCKLCQNGCVVPCKKPGEAVTPIEGTGVDVVTTLKRYKININFPIKDTFYRIGAIFYD